MCTLHVRMYSSVRGSPGVGRGGGVRDGKVLPVADSNLLAADCSVPLPPVFTDSRSVSPGHEVGEWWGEGGAGETPPSGS